MKNIEVIKLILKEKPNENIYTLFNNDDSYNLIYLCVLNEKYLNDEVLNQILNSKLIDKYLSYLLSNFPNLINKIPDGLLQNLTSFNWSIILSQQPELFNYCKNAYSFNINSWINILRKQPKLANEYKKLYKNENTLLYFILNSKEDLNINFDKLIKYNLNININKLNIYNWLDMLKYNPKLIKICPKINKINNSYDKHPYEVIELVSKQISFKYLLPSIDKISSYPLSILISNQPQLIEELKIDFKIFDAYNWSNILQKQPQLINECNKINELTPYNWASILRKQPKLIKYCDKNELTSNTWAYILTEQPKLIKYCNKIDSIPDHDLLDILIKQPELINKCNNNFTTFTIYKWVELLRKQPKLAKYCDKFDKFGDYEWDCLLENQSELIEYYGNKNILSKDNKIKILIKHPSLLDKISIDFKININSIKILYNSKKHHLKLMKNYIVNNKDKKVLTNMIGIYPDLKYLYTEKDLWKYVDFNQLSDNIEYSILK